MSFDPPPLPPIQPQWGQFQVWWQQVLGNLQGELGALAAAIAAQATADAAAADAATAQTTANTVKRDDKITGSFVVPANVVTSTDNGTNATITIAAHTRKYGDGSSLSVAGGSLTGAYSTDYGIYYNDTTTADTTPTYVKSTNLTQAVNSYAAGRHFVGNITTPASGGAATTGGYSPAGTGADSETDRNKYSSL